jgi:exopolysaccharide biosynthesis predicted pyruvyltransferase EpsI
MAAKITITHVRPAGFGLGGVPAPLPSQSAFAKPSAPAGAGLGPMPRLGPVENTLAKFEGKRAHLMHARADHGDRLAEIAAESLLHSVGVYTVRNPDKADVLVVGSGSFCDDFKAGFDALDAVSRRFPTKPLVVLPSSFHLHAADVARVFMARIEAAFVYARDAHSIEVLEELRIPWPVSIGLDDDVTFHLPNTEFFQQLLAMRAEKHLLVTERREGSRRKHHNGEADAAVQLEVTKLHPLLPPSASFSDTPTPAQSPAEESADGADGNGKPAGAGVVGRLKGLARALTPHRWPREAAQTPFAKLAAERVGAEMPALRDLPVLADDIADPAVCGFNRFAETVATAAAVVTDRVSVAILATLLDKPVWVRPGTYHKTRGVFRHSLAMRKNVRLI